MSTLEAPKYQEAFILATNGEYAPMIRFKFATDNVFALAYAYLFAVEFNKSGLITLEFTTHRVEIKGRRLEKLFGSLVNHKVIAVREHSLTDVRPPPGECCVDAVTLTTQMR
jgi:hypothetical protein